MTEVELDHAIYSGAQLKRLTEGMVPLQEEHEARLERNLGLSEWAAMPRLDKAFIIAVRRNHFALQNIQSDVETTQAEVRAKRMNVKR